MIYKTLHWYIFRELLRIFILTASALTILLAFGGTFKPLTKEGIEINQLMWILFNLMPAMLAYAIPLAALFAAVLVYWRIATDNEITACRASGVSFWALTLPALLLGLVVASTDLVFVNYVVPVFLQRTEAGVRKDIGSLVVNKINRQEPFEYEEGGEVLTIYADSAKQEEAKQVNDPDIEKRTLVLLKGLAATKLKDNQPKFMLVAKTATIVIDDMKDGDETRVWVQLNEGTSIDPNTFRKISGSVDRYPPDGYEPVRSLLKDKHKFLNYIQLRNLEANPSQFLKIEKARRDINREKAKQGISEELLAKLKNDNMLRFNLDPQTDEYIAVKTPQFALNAQTKQLDFLAQGNKTVRIEHYRGSTLLSYFTCDSATLAIVDNRLNTDDIGPTTEFYGALHLLSNVYRQDVLRNIPEVPGEKFMVIQPLELPIKDMKIYQSNDDVFALLAQISSMPEGMKNMTINLGNLIAENKKKIGSELQSRGSFAVSCLTLVLLGAALGILMGGRNPLVVFVVGFVPAIVLVLLITAGRRMVENTHGSTIPGYSMIWAGNILLLFLVVGVYSKLVRQ